MDKWTELKTAYRLAKLKTLSATSEDLGIHRSTVMRHIDALEESLGIKLFQRNDKGYIATEAGLEVMRLGEITDIHVTQFVNKAKSKEGSLEGTLNITCVPELALLLLPTINKFQSLYPKVQVHIIGDLRKYDLEYGEADIAIRTGDKPTTLDNIVLPFFSTDIVLCAHQSYVSKHGLPNATNIHQHHFLANSIRVEHLYWNEWIYLNVPKQNIVVSSNSHQVLEYALQSGTGISVSSKETIANNPNLVELDFAVNWPLNTWILVHRDMINIAKVRKFVDMLKLEKGAGINLNINE